MMKASAILAAAFCVTWFMRRRPAAERHMVWAAAIVASALLPLLSLVLPAWRPGLAGRVAAALPAIARTSTMQNLSQGRGVVFRADGIEPNVSALSRLGFILWLMGSIAGLLVIGAGIARQRWLERHSEPVSDPRLARLAADLAHQFGCKRAVYLRRSRRQLMPMTWGVLRPRVLFPVSTDSWSDERKRVVLAHELAHVHRLDRLFQTLAQTACAVYWFNPLFWIACSRLSRESEQACDDAVINLGVEARTYATHLLEIARGLKHSGGVWSAALAMARPSTLEKRFAALLNSSLNRSRATRKTVFCVSMMTFALALPLAAIRIPAAVAVPAAWTPVPRVEQYTNPPLYSDEARTRGIEGIVTLEVVVGTKGNVERLRVVKGLGYGLDENALLAVRDWRFSPAARHGVPVEAATPIDVEFNLRNAELNELIANDMATRVGPGVSPPQVVHRVEPQYSGARAWNKIPGVVILDAVVPEDGVPKIIRVIRSLDWELDEIAINAVKQWRFSPAMKDGGPIKIRMNVAVDFTK